MVQKQKITSKSMLKLYNYNKYYYYVYDHNITFVLQNKYQLYNSYNLFKKDFARLKIL